MNNRVLWIKLINWALLTSALVSTVLWAEVPQFMSRTGTTYIILGVIYTLLFIKFKLFSKQEWADNFSSLKKRLPLLIYILAMGILVHHYLETVYWAPKRQKMFDEIQKKYEAAKAVREKNNNK